jgi:hypothetical protein
MHSIRAILDAGSNVTKACCQPSNSGAMSTVGHAWKIYSAPCELCITHCQCNDNHYMRQER